MPISPELRHRSQKVGCAQARSSRVATVTVWLLSSCWMWAQQRLGAAVCWTLNFQIRIIFPYLMVNEIRESCMIQEIRTEVLTNLSNSCTPTEFSPSVGLLWSFEIYRICQYLHCIFSRWALYLRKYPLHCIRVPGYTCHHPAALGYTALSRSWSKIGPA